MPRPISITDDRRRDAAVELWSAPKTKPAAWRTAEGAPARTATVIKSPEGHSWSELLVAHGDDPAAVGQALIDGDPEVAKELVGREVGPSDRVWIRPDGSILYSARILEVVTSPDGEEKDRKDFIDVDPTVGTELPALPWSGRLFPIDTVIRKFALVRTLQIRHVNGLTFDFLFEIAKTLDKAEKMLLLGSGGKGTGPLVFSRNGSPYRGFLEGRVDDDGFMLLLHLSNLELKGLPS